MPRTILITGATDGIGLALARRYDAWGERLVLTGRREPRTLGEGPFRRHLYVAADLARPVEAAATIAAALSAHGIERLDVLVHDAATGAYGDVVEEAPSSVETTLAVNLEAVLALTHALLPRVLAARGRLVFVSSVAAFLPSPEFAAYAATKAAIDGFARSLRVEVSGRASVLVVHPGATRTGMHAKAGVPAATTEGKRWPSADAVAARIASAIDGHARERTIGWGNRIAGFLGRHAERPLDALLRRSRR